MVIDEYISNLRYFLHVNRSFWISWTSEGVKGVNVGSGVVPGVQHLTKQLDDAALVDVKYISFASWVKSTAQWQVFAKYGE